MVKKKIKIGDDAEQKQQFVDQVLRCAQKDAACPQVVYEPDSFTLVANGEKMHLRDEFHNYRSSPKEVHHFVIRNVADAVLDLGSAKQLYVVFGEGSEYHIAENIQRYAFNTAEEREAFVKGVDDAVGWHGAYWSVSEQEAHEFCEDAIRFASEQEAARNKIRASESEDA